MGTGALRGNLKAPVDVLHEHVTQVRVLQAINSTVHLTALDGQQHLQRQIQCVILHLLVLAAQGSARQEYSQGVIVLAADHQLVDFGLVRDAGFWNWEVQEKAS